jgi:hypothetical protein
MNPDAFSLEKLNRITSAYASHLCHGHELMLLLGAIFPKIAKKHLRKKVNSGADVATQLFLAYEYTMFQESKLFNEIQDWEKNNPTYRVLAS